MAFNLHSSASDNLDRKAIELFKRLEVIPPKSSNQPLKTSVSESVVKIISLTEINKFGPSISADPTGKVLSKSFLFNGKNIGLQHEGYELFEDLVLKLSNCKNIGNKLSDEYLDKTLFIWLEKKYSMSKSEHEDSFVKFLEHESEEVIKDSVIMVPFNKWLIIQSPFNIGRVRIDFYTQNFFDSQLEALLKRKPNEETKIRGYVDKLRLQFQGSVYGSMEFSGELQKGIELLGEDIQWAIAILRFYCPAAISPRLACYFDIKGGFEAPSYHYLYLEEDVLSSKSGFRDKKPFTWSLLDSQLSILRKLGFDDASALIIKEEKTDFENVLLSAIQQFSKSILFTNISDKMVFVLSSAETLLVKDKNEPIVDNVGRRLAFLADRSLEKRKGILKSFRRAYDFRSHYLHHGKSEVEVSSLEAIQNNIWNAITYCLLNSSKFPSKALLIDWIDDHMLSAVT